MTHRARIVIECAPSANTGFLYRVWTEHDNYRFGELQAPLFATAIAELLAKTERGELTPFEPGTR